MISEAAEFAPEVSCRRTVRPPSRAERAPTPTARQRFGLTSRRLGKCNSFAKELRTIRSLALPIEHEDQHEHEDDFELTSSPPDSRDPALCSQCCVSPGQLVAPILDR